MSHTSRVANPLFAMDTHFACGANRQTDRLAQFRLVKDAGFDGFHAVVNLLDGDSGLDDLLAAERMTRLPLLGVYQEINVKVPPSADALAALDRGLQRLPKATLVEFAIACGEFGEAAGDATKDEAALSWLAPLDRMLARLGLHGSIYPHFGFPIECCSDALRLLQKLEQTSMGVTFGAYHWFRVGREPNLASLLAAVAPSLRSANLNGSRILESGQSVHGLNPTIEPLDVGVMPVAEILGLLCELGYSGPIGVQGYGVDVPVEDALRRSFAVLEASLK